MPRKPITVSKHESADSAGILISKAVENLKSTPSTQAQSVLNEADRQQWIATAAYYRYERRGFNNGSEERDWLEAEAEIGGAPQPGKF